MRKKKKEKNIPEEVLDTTSPVNDKEEKDDTEKTDGVSPDVEEELESESEPDTAENIEILRAEIAALEAELESKKLERERLLEEIIEFSERLGNIPKEVWEKVRSGMSLEAAYALYEKMRELEENRKKEINERNAYRSSGTMKNSADSGYFTYSEVKDMTPAEVKKNFKMIKESMKKWN